jgi:hypothetical protein
VEIQILCITKIAPIIDILRLKKQFLTLEYLYFFILKFEYISLFFQNFQKFFRNYKINQEMYSNFNFQYLEKPGFFSRHHNGIINSSVASQ